MPASQTQPPKAERSFTPIYSVDKPLGVDTKSRPIDYTNCSTTLENSDCLGMNLRKVRTSFRFYARRLACPAGKCKRATKVFSEGQTV